MSLLSSYPGKKMTKINLDLYIHNMKCVMIKAPAKYEKLA